MGVWVSAYCEECGRGHRYFHGRGRFRRYCGVRCRQRAKDRRRRPRQTTPRDDCARCGRRLVQERVGTRLYCSDECRRDADSSRKIIRRGGERLGGVRACIICEQPFRRWNSNQTICRRRTCRQNAKKARRVRKRIQGSRPPTLEYVYRRDRGRCGLCRKRVGLSYRHPDPRSASLDHITPISKGGSDTADNIQLAHLGCNLSKSDRKCGSQRRLVG